MFVGGMGEGATCRHMPPTCDVTKLFYFLNYIDILILIICSDKSFKKISGAFAELFQSALKCYANVFHIVQCAIIFLFFIIITRLLIILLDAT